MPCLLTCNLAEDNVIESAARMGLSLTGLTRLHATKRARAGFLLGFAAFTPAELESGVRKLEKVFREAAAET